MRPVVDLHVHSTCSDGAFSVEALVQKASEGGMQGLALTDHDTFRGIKPALELCRKNQLYFIAGCEFSTYLEPIGELHILGYFSSYSFLRLESRLKQYQENRLNRIYKILDCLKTHGIEMDPAPLVKDPNLPVGRMHIAREMVKQGFVTDTEMAFERYLRAGSCCYIPRKETSPMEMIEAIHDAGGKAVLAHPTILYQSRNWEVLQRLIEAGLDGIEYKHPKIEEGLSKKIFMHYQNRMILTGGSDFHGDNPRDELGRFGIPLEIATQYFDHFTDL